ncbi:hypothetical protein [Sphingobium sp. B12D2B]|uniref:hypothetical protein n=1 Tax=Sphingobium sp. B12D2B TaxID=2940577 RepID=UPI002224E95C|nr:hypothetical protein [Sphingobium sp. B12D2B]MCW2351513.1 hypothetical protein [Sphingobium sp. B12D2B]
MPAIAACSALAMLLSACETSGYSRYANVGSPAPGSGGGSDGGSNNGGGGTDTGGGNTGGGNTGGGNTGGGNTGGGGSADGGGSTGGGLAGGVVTQVSPVLATAGNAVLGVADGQQGVTTPIAAALPVTQPVTGTITRVLQDTGTVLVDAGEGRTLLLQGAQGVVGDVVSIDVGGRAVTNGLDGTAGAIGVGVLGDTQPTGTLASAGVLNAGNTALATVNGIADVRVTNITAPTGGISDNLLNVALGGNQLLGSGDPALVNANVLPNGASLPGGGTGAVGGVLGAVSSTVGSVGGAVGVGGDVSGGGVLGGGTATGGDVNGGVLGTVGATVGSVGGALGVGGSVEAGAGAGAGTTTNGGLLAPVTGTLNTVGTSLGLGR